MPRQHRNVEGDNEQRRARAREAREQGKLPSEEGVTLGASKQTRKAKPDETHQERLETRDKGKRGPGSSGKPRPGNRDTDPKRTDRWG
ncbi:MAG: hypothetical protein ACJ79K_03925 [Gemmatimonadaceae bacterium]